MDRHPISHVQAVIILLLAVGISNHVLIMPMLLKAAGRDAWLSGACAFLPLAAWCVPLYGLMRITGGEPVFAWLRRRYPAAVVSLLKAPILIYLALTLYIAVRDTTSWTRIAYLPETPTAVVAGLLVICGLLAARSGLRTIAVTGGFLLPAVIVLGYFVMTANFQFKDYGYLHPVLERGILHAGRGMEYTLGGLFELIFLLFVPYRGNRPISLPVLLLVALMLVGLIVGPTTGAIAVFGPYEAARLRYPAFELWRMVVISRFISHLDFFSIYQWISGALIRISFAVFLLTDLFGIGGSRHFGKRLAILCLLAYIAVVAIPLSDMIFVHMLYRYFYPAAAAFLAVFPLLLFALARWKRGGRYEAAEMDEAGS